MGISDFLKGLTIDVWYKVFVYLGALLFVISLFASVKCISNCQLQLFSMGMFLIGIGEWENHKHSWTHGEVRQPDLVGTLLELTGVILVILSICGIIRSLI